MSSHSIAVALAALALSGCLSSQDELFPLAGGDSVAAKPGAYACRSVDAHAAAKVVRARLVLLRSDGRTQYVFLAPDNSSAEPAALHRVAEGVYIVALAHDEGPGEDLYLATVAAGGAVFRLYSPAATAIAAAPAVAARSGATLVHNTFGDDLSGPVEAQRAFALAFAGDLKNWRLAVDCRLP